MRIRTVQMRHACGIEVSAEDYALTDAAGHKWEDGVCTVCGAESPFQTAPEDPSDNVPEAPSEDVPADDPAEDAPTYPDNAWKYLSDLFSPWL